MLSIPRPAAERFYWNQLRLRGRGDVRERLAWLQSNESRTPAEIDEIQATKLRELVRHAVNTVPYYARLFAESGLRADDIHGPADLARLPLLTRSVLATNKEALISNQADRATLQTNYSSGSTGQRAEFDQDLDFRLWMRAHQLRTYSWCSDWQLGERFVLLWGSEIYWSLRQPIERWENRLSNRREFNTFQLSPELIQRFAGEIAHFAPVLVSSYSNALHLVVRELERHPRALPNGLALVASTKIDAAVTSDYAGMDSDAGHILTCVAPLKQRHCAHCPGCAPSRQPVSPSHRSCVSGSPTCWGARCTTSTECARRTSSRTKPPTTAACWCSQRTLSSRSWTTRTSRARRARQGGWSVFYHPGQVAHLLAENNDDPRHAAAKLAAACRFIRHHRGLGDLLALTLLLVLPIVRGFVLGGVSLVPGTHSVNARNAFLRAWFGLRALVDPRRAQLA